MSGKSDKSDKSAESTRHFICDKCVSVPLVPRFEPHGHNRAKDIRRCCWCGLVATTKNWRRIHLAFLKVS